MIGQIIGGIATGLIGAGSEQIATDKSNVASAKEALKQRLWAGGRQDIGMDFSAREAKKSWDRGETSAKISRGWQEKMSNTQYQRAIADMKRAGINPMLAFMKGGAGTPAGATGKSTPASAVGPTSGATAQVKKADYARNVQSMVSSALGVQRLKKDIELIDEKVGFTKNKKRQEGVKADIAESYAPSLITVGNLYGKKSISTARQAMLSAKELATMKFPQYKTKYMKQREKQNKARKKFKLRRRKGATGKW